MVYIVKLLETTFFLLYLGTRTEKILYSPTHISLAFQEQKPLQEMLIVKVHRSDIKTAGADRIKYAYPHVEHVINSNDLVGIGLSLDKHMTTKIGAKLKVIDQKIFVSTVEFQPGSIDSPMPHSLPNPTATVGITCKERSSKPRMEMRGTNYWTLYNYIPADEVTYF